MRLKFSVVFMLILLNIIAQQDFKSLIKTEIPKLSFQELPNNFWWGNVNGTNYLTLQKNQHIPQYCGSCWAFAVTSSLSDRIKIMRNASWPDINLAPQILLSCDMVNRGCRGGNPPLAYKWIHQNNITDQTCSPYQALSHKQSLGCSAQIKCLNCTGTSCTSQGNAKIYSISQYGVITQKQGGQIAMMNQIYHRGPISCQIAIVDKLYSYTEGIFFDQTGKKGYDHDISVTGWGEQNGVKFWHIRNSWGTYWGQNGDIRLIRGIDNLGIQSNCSWGVPLDTWSGDIRNKTSFKSQQKITKNIKIRNLDIIKEQASAKACYIPTKQKFQHIQNPLPSKYLKASDIPQQWDWRNASGINYLSINRNQNAPNHCNSCWAVSAISALSDRINIARNRTWPDVLLSAQYLINCQIGGTCTGGNSLNMYHFSHLSAGIPQQTCQNYLAKNPQEFTCSDIHRCKDASSHDPYGFATLRYPVWRVKQYAAISGVANMKAQIYVRGPITCALQSTTKFQSYTGGIFAQTNLSPTLNHQVSIVGWGSSNGVQYWIGRNSWGTAWGESGFFRIQMYRNNNGIQTQCSWGGVQKIARIVDLRQKQVQQNEQIEQ